MAKTRAPLLSVEAMGSIASTLTCSRSRGRSYTKYSRKPKDPKSEAQLGRRAWFKGLANSWTSLPGVTQATWDNYPRENYLSNYNAFLRYNLERIDRGLFPSAEYPYGGIGLVGYIGTPTLLSGPRHIRSTWTYTDVRQNWLCVIYRSSVNGFTPSRDNTLAVLFKQDLLPFDIMDAPLEPGTYYYRKSSIAIDGYRYLWSAQPSAVVPVS